MPDTSALAIDDARREPVAVHPKAEAPLRPTRCHCFECLQLDREFPNEGFQLGLFPAAAQPIRNSQPMEPQP